MIICHVTHTQSIIAGVYEWRHVIKTIESIKGIKEIGFLLACKVRYFRTLNTLITALFRFLGACNHTISVVEPFEYPIILNILLASDIIFWNT